MCHERILVTCCHFSGECHRFKHDCKFIELYLPVIWCYWFLQCVQACLKVRVFVLMKKEFVKLVQATRFHCPIGMIFVTLKALLTEVLFSFTVSPFGYNCSGKPFCTRFGSGLFLCWWPQSFSCSCKCNLFAQCQGVREYHKNNDWGWGNCMLMTFLFMV